jgi:chloramphenicol O-acetyltransferase
MQLKLTRLRNLLTNEFGGALIINDIAAFAYDLIKKGTKTFAEFQAAMKSKFGDVWDKLSKIVKSMWDVINNQRGEVEIRPGRTPNEPSELFNRFF